jgi:hypothetical protein
MRTYLKNKAKKGWGVAEVVECKLKALSSSPSAAQKGKDVFLPFWTLVGSFIPSEERQVPPEPQ